MHPTRYKMLSGKVARKMVENLSTDGGKRKTAHIIIVKPIHFSVRSESNNNVVAFAA